MEITVLQVLGISLMVFGGYGLYKGYIPWSIEAGSGGNPQRNGFQIDLTPESSKWQKEGKFEGKWVRPICSIVFIFGFVLLFIPSESIVFKI